MSSLADRVNARLRVTGLSPADLAREVGVKAPSVSNWLSGKTKTIKGEFLLLAAQALQCSPRWLSTGHGAVNDDAAGAVHVVREDTVRYIADPLIEEATEILRLLDRTSRSEALLWLRGFAAGRKTGRLPAAAGAAAPGRAASGG